MVVEIVRVLVEEFVKLGRNGQCESGQPEEKHRTSYGQFADVAPMPGCSPKLHSAVIEHGIGGNASEFLTTESACGLHGGVQS